MQDTQDVFRRIDGLMKRLNRQQKEMDNYLCLPKGTYSHWVQKKSSSYMYHLGEISEFLGVSPNYLILGADGKKTGERIRAVTDEEAIFLEAFEKTKAEDRNLLLEILQAFVRHGGCNA